MKLNITKPYLLLLLLLPVALGGLGGCTGTQTFGTVARAGDTVALPIGLKKNLKRQNLTVTITPATGNPVIYAPNDSKIRGVVNLYPDPVSKTVVGTATKQDFDVNANATTGALIKAYVTQDNDWWQTTMLLDLPLTISTGKATISIADSGGTVIKPISVEILAGIGATNNFDVYTTWGGTYPVLNAFPMLIRSMERADNYTIAFVGPTIPHALQVEFTHTTGAGVPWISNPRGDIKNVTWTDNGTTLKVMVAPTAGVTLQTVSDLKFYITGGVTGLAQTSLKAYDITGSPITGVTATVTAQ